MTEDGKRRSLLGRITIDPRICQGQPVIGDLQLTVEQVLAMLAAGASYKEVLNANPGIVQEDILACLDYARRLVACFLLE